MGSKGSLRNMLHRSLGAGTFGRFWQFWNPIFGYYLANKVYIPLRTFLPAWFAVIVTFGFSGLLHDVVTAIVRGDLAFLFIPWFLLMGTGVAVGSWLNIDYSSQTWFVRALINVIYVGGCLSAALTVKI